MNGLPSVFDDTIPGNACTIMWSMRSCFQDYYPILLCALNYIYSLYYL
jgi:hypothetical protein